MTTKEKTTEMIAVMQAYEQGAVIEFKIKELANAYEWKATTGCWLPCTIPNL